MSVSADKSQLILPWDKGWAAGLPTVPLFLCFWFNEEALLPSLPVLSPWEAVGCDTLQMISLLWEVCVLVTALMLACVTQKNHNSVP